MSTTLYVTEGFRLTLTQIRAMERMFGCEIAEGADFYNIYGPRKVARKVALALGSAVTEIGK